MAYAFNDNKTKFQIPDRGSGNWVSISPLLSADKVTVHRSRPNYSEEPGNASKDCII